ncbi:MAG: transporter [Pseudomonadota bacterium]
MRRLTCLCALLAIPGAAFAQDASELAQQLSNPVADLVSVPLQLNFDQNFGEDDDGDRTLLNIQPVIPFRLNDDWNLISRTILPLVVTDDIPLGTSNEGIGDIVQSAFFSPAASRGGTTWGIGPVFLLPTATEDALGAGKWGVGPTAVVLQQTGPWTYGGLANHIWSFAGDDDRDDVNSTFLQPFLAYTTPTAVTYTINSESTYDWEASEWSIPINAVISKVFTVGTQTLSLAGGVRYWAESPPGGPEGFGARVVLTLIYPK